MVIQLPKRSINLSMPNSSKAYTFTFLKVKCQSKWSNQSFLVLKQVVAHHTNQAIKLKLHSKGTGSHRHYCQNKTKRNFCRAGRKRTWLQRSGLFRSASAKCTFGLSSLNTQESTAIIQPMTLAFSRLPGIEIFIKTKTGFVLTDFSFLRQLTFHHFISFPNFFPSTSEEETASYFQGHDFIPSHFFS